MFSDRRFAEVVSVYLFGSEARGTPHRESDVDVAVLVDRALVPERSARSQLRVRLASELIAATGNNRVDLVVLNDVPAPFARAVVTEGKRIYCREEEADRRFVRDARLRAADLDPFLERMRRIKLEALRG
jgi:predicted nucleotidyltransferase